jgi:hypothetical protein
MNTKKSPSMRLTWLSKSEGQIFFYYLYSKGGPLEPVESVAKGPISLASLSLSVSVSVCVCKSTHQKQWHRQKWQHLEQ